jgi:hypothetical protein
MAFFDKLFADDDTRESFSQFRRQYPWATYDDWWDAQAATISGNESWHPANDPDFNQRGSRFQGNRNDGSNRDERGNESNQNGRRNSHR